MSLNNEDMERSIKGSGFHKYQHIVRLGEPEVDGILQGDVYCFPKLDGTQRQMFYSDGEIKIAGHDGFLPDINDKGSKKFKSEARFVNFFKEYPNLRLFGEYLIPHSLKFYSSGAWNKLYIFDVAERIGEDRSGQSIWRYLKYEEYVPMLENYGVDYIPLAIKFKCTTKDELISAYDKSGWLTDGNKVGEGFVIKNYDFKAYNGRTLWAKLVWREIPEIKAKLNKAKQDYSNNMNNRPIEERIIEMYLTESFIEKEYYKLCEVMTKDSKGFEARFLNTVYKTLLEEEIYHIVKKFGNPEIKFDRLKKLCEDNLNNFLDLEIKGN